MLELRPNCECCDKDLPPEAPRRDDLHLRMHVLRRLRRERASAAPAPIAAANFRARPDPPGRQCSPKYPASTKRVLRADGCAPMRKAA